MDFGQNLYFGGAIVQTGLIMECGLHIGILWCSAKMKAHKLELPIVSIRIWSRDPIFGPDTFDLGVMI